MVTKRWIWTILGNNFQFNKFKKTTYYEFLSQLDETFQKLKQAGLFKKGGHKITADMIYKEIEAIRRMMFENYEKNIQYLKFVPRNPVSGAFYTVGAVVGGTLASASLPFIGAYKLGRKAYESEQNEYGKVAMGFLGGIGGLIGGALAVPVGVVASVMYGAAQPLVGLGAMGVEICHQKRLETLQKEKLDKESDQLIDFDKMGFDDNGESLCQVLGKLQQFID